MRKLAVTQNITFDGAIEMLGDWFKDQEQADDGELLAENHRQTAAADALLTGRQTFEDMRSYWPDVPGDKTGVSDYLNGVQKYVISSTMTDPQWQNTTVLSGDPIEEVRKLKSQPGKDIVTTGSITLVHALIGAGVVDEYRLFTYPLVQGKGRRLFPDGFELPKMKRLDVKPFANGVTYSCYAPA